MYVCTHIVWNAAITDTGRNFKYNHIIIIYTSQSYWLSDPSAVTVWITVRYYNNIIPIKVYIYIRCQ